MALIPVPVGLKSADQVIADAFAALGCPKLGGVSGKGWSRDSVAMRCPYKYYLRYVRKMHVPLVAASSMAQDAGSFVHAMLAVHYARLLPPPFKGDDGQMYSYPGWAANTPTPEALFEAFQVHGGEVEALGIAQRLWDGYLDKWGGSDWRPLAVEMQTGDPQVRTSRDDLVVLVEDDGIYDGLWIVDHKTASSSADMEQWHLDGEIIGEMFTWGLDNLDEMFGGSLRGVCINVLIKGSSRSVNWTPTYRRIWIPVNWALVKDFLKHLLYWNDQVKKYTQIGYWPKAHTACVDRFHQRCLYWDHCLTLSDSYLAPIRVEE